MTLSSLHRGMRIRWNVKTYFGYKLPRSILFLCVAWPVAVAANDVEPRLYANIPTGTNFLSLGYAQSSGEVSFDSSIPASDVEGEIDSIVLRYSRALSVANKSALLTIAVPYADVFLEGIYLGQPASGQRQGMGDPIVRLAVNLYGAPAMTRAEFRSYEQQTIVGASIAVGIPVGRYVKERIINVGTNRWTVLAQLGISHSVRRWTFEAGLGFAWFSDNEEFLGTTLEQDPIGLFRSTLLYSFKPGLWLSAGFLYAHGGDTRANGVQRDDRLQNWRTGVAISIPLARGHNLQLRATEGIRSRIGSDFRTYAASYTYTF